MSAPMTLEEAVRVFDELRATDRGMNLTLTTHETDALYALRAHAERALAARGGEPEGVQFLRQIAGGAFDITDEGRARCQQIAEYIDDLTARLDAVTRERDALVEAIDREMVTACIGTFAHGDDANAALKELIAWAHGVGAYFAKESPNA